jgi:hypothetical protein
MELAADVLFVNNVPFLISISASIHNGTATIVENLQAESLEAGLKNVMRSYIVRGFHTVIVIVDMQFKYLRDYNRLDARVNIVSRGEYIKMIECFHWVIKERARCYYAILPFNLLLCMMVVYLIITVVFYINTFV